VLYPRLKKKIETNKSEYGENLSCTFDRAVFVVYKSNIFPTVSFFVPEKIELLEKQFFLRLIGRIKFLKQDVYIIIVYESKDFFRPI
jgi:hypothetical protein